jgi:hypothetical protein
MARVPGPGWRGSCRRGLAMSRVMPAVLGDTSGKMERLGRLGALQSITRWQSAVDVYPVVTYRSPM